jgi:hypothetical protein
MKPGTIELYAGGMMLLLELFSEGTFPREDLEVTGVSFPHMERLHRWHNLPDEHLESYGLC